MKKIGELMSEMGFKENAPNSVKEAFIKHLIRAAADVHVTTPTEKIEIEENNIPQISYTQLSFDFNETETASDVSEVS